MTTDEEELKMVPIINNYNNSNVVSESDSDDNIESDNKNFFDEDIDDQVKATPKTTINAKVVQPMKKLQASYNNDANKIVKQATQKKNAIENLNFVINLPW